MSVDGLLDKPQLDDRDFVNLLSKLGAARLEDERLGGPYWADFQDWCFHVQEPTSPRALDLWLGERCGVELSAKQIARLRGLAEQA